MVDDAEGREKGKKKKNVSNNGPDVMRCWSCSIISAGGCDTRMRSPGHGIGLGV